MSDPLLVQHLKRFARAYIWPRRVKFGIVQVMHVVAVLLLLIPPMLIRHVIDESVPAKDYDSLMWAAGAILVIYAVWAVIHGLKEYWGHEVAQRVTWLLRNDLYGHVQKLSMSFHDRKKTGEMLSRLVDDVNVIQEFVHHGPDTFLVGVVSLTGTAAILFYLNAKLAVAALLAAPALFIFTRHSAAGMLEKFKLERKRKASLSDVLEENLSGIRVIKAFAGEDREARAVSAANQAHYASRMGAIRYIATLFPGAMLINNIAVAVVLFYGGYLTIQNTITVGTFTAFIFYLQRFYQPILQLIMMVENGGEFFAGIERFHEYMDVEPDIRDAPDAQPLAAVRGAVEFQDVYFKYDDAPVLHDINLRAEPGQMVALVGPSGAGKTTITRLIPRFYEPYQGRVLVDGHDVRTLTMRSLLGHVGVVMQDDFLFSGTVADNIGYAREEATREEVVEAAVQANAASFVEALPDGYDTIIGKRGVKLSQGQRQRISIARALLKNPQILILDEATSSVDSETELLIQQAIERLRKGRTTFAIAHRLSTILEADQILFVAGGRITERGTHQELMALRGQYARFYRIQFEQMAAGQDELRRMDTSNVPALPQP